MLHRKTETSMSHAGPITLTDGVLDVVCGGQTTRSVQALADALADARGPNRAYTTTLTETIATLTDVEAVAGSWSSSSSAAA